MTLRATPVALGATLATPVLLAVTASLAPRGADAQAGRAEAPTARVYRNVDGRELEVHVFRPRPRLDGAPLPAILLFHGGGWTSGEPAWTFSGAEHFRDMGMIAIAVEYRLADDGTTPVAGFTDACAAFAWVRDRAGELNVDLDRVAGYGVSAGGHLVAATATVGCGAIDESVEPFAPSALLLWSPALDVTTDGWFAGLLEGAPVEPWSPAQHVNEYTPPTSIVIGDRDTTTPIEGARRYCEALSARGTRCDLNVYEGLGHLLTRDLAEQERAFDPDPAARRDAIRAQQRFLFELGFIEGL